MFAFVIYSFCTHCKLIINRNVFQILSIYFLSPYQLICIYIFSHTSIDYIKVKGISSTLIKCTLGFVISMVFHKMHVESVEF